MLLDLRLTLHYTVQVMMPLLMRLYMQMLIILLTRCRNKNLDSGFRQRDSEFATVSAAIVYAHDTAVAIVAKCYSETATLLALAHHHIKTLHNGGLDEVLDN